mmetsp:Transcript_21231/g.51290  ORF Transcript_21231/g.51290 Transcript_21231/m.51290 type:complete len:210 (+) Transcript_21231:1472-2101(+)
MRRRRSWVVIVHHPHGHQARLAAESGDPLHVLRAHLRVPHHVAHHAQVRGHRSTHGPPSLRVHELHHGGHLVRRQRSHARYNSTSQWAHRHPRMRLDTSWHCPRVQHSRPTIRADQLRVRSGGLRCHLQQRRRGQPRPALVAVCAGLVIPVQVGSSPFPVTHHVFRCAPEGERLTCRHLAPRGGACGTAAASLGTTAACSPLRPTQNCT